MRVLSIDPGLSGAVVLTDPGELMVRRDFKHPEDLTRAIDVFSQTADVAVIELVAARPGQGVSSMFNFGLLAGVALGALLANGFSSWDREKRPLLEIAPQAWQNYYRNLPGTPCPFGFTFDSVAVALKFHQRGEHYLARIKDHNTADAMLIGLWYVINQPAMGSLREKDRGRLAWLEKHFNCPQEKD